MVRCERTLRTNSLITWLPGRPITFLPKAGCFHALTACWYNHRLPIHPGSREISGRLYLFSVQS